MRTIGSLLVLFGALAAVIATLPWSAFVVSGAVLYSAWRSVRG